LVYSIAWAGLVIAQTPGERVFMLQSPVHLSGIVTDTDGKALADVSIQHALLKDQQGKTDGQGRFDIRTQAPAIVFRKDGFTGNHYRVQRDDTLQIKLEPARQFPACRSSSDCVSLKGWPSRFCFQRVHGVKVTAQGNDIDYGQRWFVIQTPAGKRGFQHGAGGMWSFGLPFDEDVWSATEYIETDYRDPEGFLIIDARGQNVNGECLHVLGHFGETASYRKVSQDQAGLLDKVLDSACVLSR
jgi:hypothetical protein